MLHSIRRQMARTSRGVRRPALIVRVVAVTMAGLCFGGTAWAVPVDADEAPDVPAALRALVEESERLQPLVESPAVREFLAATRHLPEVEPRTLYMRRSPFGAVSQAEYEGIAEAERKALQKVEWGTRRYYAPLFGTPLGYARPLDIAVEAAGIESFAGKRIFDFGYGGIAQLRLLAACGADAVGADPASFFPALYTEPGDQGEYAGPSGRVGRVTLAHGYWPAAADMAKRVGGDFDLVISKNVLKRGFVCPLEPVTDPNARVDLKTDHETFRRELARCVAAGGLVLIYNLGHPPGPDEAYRPQDDLESPYTEKQWRSVGFEILRFNADDSEMARKHAVAFGWYKSGGAERLVARYTLLRRPS